MNSSTHALYIQFCLDAGIHMCPYISLYSLNAEQCRISESVCVPLMCGARQHHPSAERCEANLMMMAREKKVNSAH